MTGGNGVALPTCACGGEIDPVVSSRGDELQAPTRQEIPKRTATVAIGLSLLRVIDGVIVCSPCYREHLNHIVRARAVTRNRARGVKRILVNSPINLPVLLFFKRAHGPNEGDSKEQLRRVVSA